MMRSVQIVILSLLWCAVAAAQSRVAVDEVGEAAIRRADLGADGFVDEDARPVPDLVGYQIGRWQPDSPIDDVFLGDWSDTGGFVRFDFALLGLINPPGPLALVTDDYLPYLYGPNPFIGFVEFDVDADPETGGEIDFPEFRFLGNAGRFGGRVGDPQWLDRMAVCGADMDGVLQTVPLVERSGEEFHLSFLGDDIIGFTPVLGDADSVFEFGETWIVHANWLHRSHAFERYSGAGGDGVYEPAGDFLFEHRVPLDWTIISFVFPLTNVAAAAARGEIEQPSNGNDADQASILEGLGDLTTSVQAIPLGDILRLDPEFKLIRAWGNKIAAAHLNPSQWNVNLIVGMAYVEEDGSGALFAPTDVQPGPLLGDFDGDGIIKAFDITLFDEYVAMNDGVSPVDLDGVVDGVICIPDFGPNFCMYDLNYDGVIDDDDRQRIVIMGDLNLDLVVDLDDLPIFITLLLHPELSPAPVPPGNAVSLQQRVDFRQDGVVDGADIQGFVSRLLAE